MQPATIISLLLASLVSAAPSVNVFARVAGQAILQFETKPDTFSSDTAVSVPGSVAVSGGLVGATIAEVTSVSNPNHVSCQAFNGKAKVGTPFNLDTFVNFNAERQIVQVSKITCSL